MRRKLTPNSFILTEPLPLLERIPSNSIDLIYLDPPWDIKSYTFDSTYEILISKLFQQAYRVLKSTGKLVIHALANQDGFFHSEAKLYFGYHNLLDTFIIPRKYFRKQHEALIVYSRSERTFFNKKVRKVPAQELTKRFPYEDEQGRYQRANLFHFSQDARTAFSWRGIQPREGVSWKYSKKKLDELYENKQIEIHAGKAYLKRYLSDKDLLEDIPTIWDDLDRLPHERKKMISIPLSGFERLLEYATNKDDLVLVPICYSDTIIKTCAQLERLWIAGSDLSTSIDNDVTSNLWEGKIDFQIVDSSEFYQLQVICNAYEFQNSQKALYIRDVITKGEGSQTEFKKSACWNDFLQSKDSKLIEGVLEAICGFLNSPTGGKVLIGVNDDGEVVGIEKDIECADKKKKNSDGYLLYLNNTIADKLGKSVLGKYHVSIYEYDSKAICLLEVNNSPDPVFFDGNYYIRNGNQTKKLSAEETYHILVQKTDGL